MRSNGKELFMKPDDLSALLPHIAAQFRASLSNLYLAALQLAPPAAREGDEVLDRQAALLDQSYYQLIRLVNNLTAARYFKEGELPLRDQDIVGLAEGVFERSEYLANLHGLNMTFSCPMEHHICAICPDALEQLLYHLISNAVKFTPSGGLITISLRRSQKRILLSVEDTGAGIPEERLANLFEFHAPEDPLPPPHGLGLGLPLCRRIAEGHGGAMMVESRLGRGSRFTLSIPDRVLNRTVVSDVRFDYTGGFNATLLGLADTLPVSAFRVRNQD